MKSLNTVIILFATLAVIGAGLFFFPASPLYYKTFLITNSASVTPHEDKSGSEQNQTSEDNISENPVTSASDDETGFEDEEKPSEDVSENQIVKDVGSIVLTERKLGNPDAPVKIMEFSSLSCGHCGKFHAEVFPKIKEDFINAGKVELIMIDFPLNFPALQATMLAHCVPEDQYFNFLQLLFTSQESWLSGDYLAKLKQNAQLAGLSNDQVDSCLANKDLENALVARNEEMQTKWNISSTPSFVINNGEETIVGGQDYEGFAASINRALLKSSAQ